MKGPAIDKLAAPNEAVPCDQYRGVGLPRWPMNPTENAERRGPLMRAFHSTVHCGTSLPVGGGFQKSVFFGGPVQSVVDGAGASRKSRSLAGSMPLFGLVGFCAVTTGGTIAQPSEISVP